MDKILCIPRKYATIHVCPNIGILLQRRELDMRGCEVGILLKGRIADIRLGENPYDIMEVAQLQIENIPFFGSKEKKHYLGRINKEMEIVAKECRQREVAEGFMEGVLFSEELVRMLQDIIIQISTKSWNSLLWIWEEKRYSRNFFQIVLEEMAELALPEEEQKRILESVIEAYKRVIRSEPMAMWVRLEPIKKQKYMFEIPKENAVPKNYTPRNFANAIFSKLKFEGESGLQTPGFESKMKKQIIKHLEQ